MGRKNKREQQRVDTNFDKFVKSIMAENKKQEPKPVYQKPTPQPVVEQTREERVKYRTDYAIKKLSEHNIEYILIRSSDGYIQCYRKSDRQLFHFFASNGYILDFNDFRGITALITLLLQEV